MESQATEIDNDPAVLKALELKTKELYNKTSVSIYSEDYRRHLGASVIGKDCDLDIWYGWRWARKDLSDAESDQHKGRMLRLFQRGHREEPIIIEHLRRAGFKVWDRDPNTGEQYRMSYEEGHYGGSLDGIIEFPPEFNFPHACLLSCKTSGTGSAFNKFANEEMKSLNRRYWAQECAYGRAYGIAYTLWAIVNKNDDDIHFILRKLDWNHGEQMQIRANRIILAQDPPPKISKSITARQCINCNHRYICHKGEGADVNCRSCKHARPQPGKQWKCTLHEQMLTDADIMIACQSWDDITK